MSFGESGSLVTIKFVLGLRLAEGIGQCSGIDFEKDFAVRALVPLGIG